MNLAQVFAQSGITHAHVIDDAFNRLPNSVHGDAEIQNFVRDLEDDQVEALASLLGVTDDGDSLVGALSDLSNIQSLFKKRLQFLPASEVLFAQFVRERKEKKNKIQPLLDCLKGAGVSCHKCGTDSSAKGKAAPQLIFIDLHLSESNHLTVDDALREYGRVMEAHGDAKPFVFLFSTLAAALENNKEEFRKRAKIFISQFEALDKARLADREELEEILSSYAGALPRLRQMHVAVSHVCSAVQAAQESMAETLLSLDLVDYFVLHANTVSIEKSKLGTYVSEILLEYLLHEVEQAKGFWDFAAELDSWDLKQVPRSRFGFTRPVRKIYSGNMLHASGRLASEVRRNLAPQDGYFALGDIFFRVEEVKSGKIRKALAIITPACDLARPEELLERTILLCEGKVTEVKSFSLPTADHGAAAVVIDHPTAKEKQLLVKWDRKRLVAWHRDDIEKFSKSETAEWARVGRMRPLYALQLQHSVTADQSRIGVQRTPSLLMPHGLTAFVRDGDVWRSLDNKDVNEPSAAAVSVTEDKKKKTAFIVSDPSAHRIYRVLRQWVRSHPKSPTHERLTQFLGQPGNFQRLLYGEQALNAKQEYDRVFYPFEHVEGHPVPKALAFVRPDAGSPYDSVGGGKKAAEDQAALVLFKFCKVGA